MFDYRHAVIYQVWPRSFQDSNQDGIGDINGVRSRLSYLKQLGINALWLSPVYSSPNDDFGYDISDYYSINPEYGTMDDLKALIQEAKALDIAVIMDLVANHTSTRHAWFQQALKDPSSPYRDYYYFRRGTETQPPNNWLSFFGTSAWTKAEKDMYYLTLYADTQADLNWNNPEVREEIMKVMRFYLDMGVAGFRMDTINTIDKRDGLPSKNPEKKGYQFAEEYVLDGPRVQTWLREIHDKVLEPYDAFALGEGVMVTVNSASAYTRPSARQLNMMFQFDLVTLGFGELGKYDCRKLYHFTDRDVKAVTRRWQNAMMQKDGCYIGNYLSNHDQQRQLNRFGNIHRYRALSAKMLALYDFSLYGTPFIYQGEEIGMVNPHLKKKDWRDYECFHSSKAMTTILGIPPFIAEIISSKVSRDNARTPMQWNADSYAGFSSSKPWIRVNSDYPQWNVEKEQKDPDSVWNFYAECIRVRREHPSLSDGKFIELIPDHPHVLAFLRQTEKETLAAVINLSGFPASVHFETDINGEDLLSNYPKRTLQKQMKLSAYEAHLFLVK